MFSARLKQYIDYQNLSVRAFEEKTLITQGTVSRTIKNKLVLSGENIIKISKRWPSLNMEWLLTGENEMIRSEENKLKEMLKKAEQDVIYWKNLVDTLSLAVREKYSSDKNEK